MTLIPVALAPWGPDAPPCRCEAAFVLPLALGHGVVDLVLQSRGAGVAHAQLALERQRRQSYLCLAEQTDREKPRPQRQLGVLKQAAHGERGLVAAAQALKELASAVADDVVLSSIAARAAKAAGPAGALDGLRALVLGTKMLEELRRRHAVLELDEVECHDLDSDW